MLDDPDASMDPAPWAIVQDGKVVMRAARHFSLFPDAYEGEYLSYRPRTLEELEKVYPHIAARVAAERVIAQTIRKPMSKLQRFLRWVAPYIIVIVTIVAFGLLVAVVETAS